MKVVYIAGPFRAYNPLGEPDGFAIQQNIMRAMALALEVWKLGAFALCPHANAMFFQGAEGIPDQTWLDGDLAFIARGADALLMTPDWRSSQGATEEKRFAELKGIPVFFNVPTLAAWLEQQRQG